MIPPAADDVIEVLEDSIDAIKNNDLLSLHGLSNRLLHSISIYQDKDIIDAAVAIHAVDKIIEKEKFQKHPKIEDFKKDVVEHLKNASGFLKEEDFRKYEKEMEKLLSEIQSFNRQIKVYISDVLDYAKIKKGSKIYEHGISLGQTTEALGVTKWELMHAVGESAERERFPGKFNVKKRLDLIKELFGGR